METNKDKTNARTTLIARTAEQMLLAGMTPTEAAAVLRTQMIELKLEQEQGNQCHTARELRMHRNTLSRDIHGSPRLQQALRRIREARMGSQFARRAANRIEYDSGKRQPAARLMPERRLDQSRLDQSRLDDSERVA